MALLELKEIAMWYEDERVLFSHVNYAFPHRGVFALLGGSGSGKSTLLHLLSGNLKPKEGKVFYRGKDLMEIKGKERSNFHSKEVALLFQHYELLEGMDAVTNVELPLLLSGMNKREARKKAEVALKEMGLKGKERQIVSTLSGGEKQRVAFARALINDPKVLFADEPTGALDEGNAKEVMERLQEEGEKRLVIFVTHNESFAQDYADEVLRLHDGKLIGKPLLKGGKEEGEKERPGGKASWRYPFLIHNLKKDRWKVGLGFFATTVAFLSSFLAVGFMEGSKASLDEHTSSSPMFFYAECKKKEEIEVKGSPLSLIKESRASLLETAALLEEGYAFEEDLRYFFLERQTLKKDSGLSFSGNFFPLKELSSSLIKEGEGFRRDDFSSIYINESFAGEHDVKIGDEFDVLFSKTFVYREITEELEGDFRFKVRAIVKDFSFMGEARVYYSYDALRDFLNAFPLPVLSKIFPEKNGLLDYIDDLGEDSIYRGEATLVFAQGENEAKQMHEKMGKENEEGYVLSSPLSLQRQAFLSLCQAFDAALTLFMVIGFVSLVFLLGMSGLACFSAHKKECAILRVLGAKEKEVSSLFEEESMMGTFLGILCAFLLYFPLKDLLNGWFFTRFQMGDLIRLPWTKGFGIPFLYPILFLAFGLLISYLSVRIPLMRSASRPYIEELKDE